MSANNTSGRTAEEVQLPEFTNYIIDEINGYTNKRDGWKEQTPNYESYDLVCRVLRQVADKYIHITCKEALAT